MTYGDLTSFYGFNNVQSLGKGACHGLGGSVWILNRAKDSANQLQPLVLVVASAVSLTSPEEGLHASTHRYPSGRPHAFLPGTSHDDPRKKVLTDIKLQEAGRLKLRPSFGILSCTSDVRSWWVKTSLKGAQVENVCKQRGALLLFFSSSRTLGDYVGVHFSLVSNVNMYTVSYLCLLLSSCLSLTAAVPTSPNTLPPANNHVVNQTSCNGKQYTYQQLAGYGFIPSNARDSFGDNLGGWGSAIAIDQKSWRKLKNGTYIGTLYAVPDRGWYVRSQLRLLTHLLD